MPRDVDHERKAALTEAVADHLISCGNVRDSLRDIATSIDSSARMLVHHFGSREEMLNVALEVARARQLNAAKKAIQPGPNAAATLRDVWIWFRRPDTRRYFSLFSDVAAYERSNAEHDRRFTSRLGTEWRPLFEELFREDNQLSTDAESLAYLTVATLRGLALDLGAGTDSTKQHAAYEALIEMIEIRRGNKKRERTRIGS
jgi:AcrR family transcriptional regulator